MYKRMSILAAAILLAIIVGLLLSRQLDLASASSGQASPTAATASEKPSRTPASVYDPAYYGLPDTIAGYKVLAVLTSDNTACMPPGAKRLILQTTQPTVEEFLKTSDAAGIKAELEQKGFPEFAKWGVEIGGPDATFDKVVSENEDWNAFSRKYGCVTSGPPATSAPTP